MTKTFAPLKAAKTTVERCEDALKRAVFDGSFPKGTRLPAERQLAEQFGVNRVTVRGALVRLAAQGILHARQGSGYWVQDYLRTGGPRLLSGLVQQVVGTSAYVEFISDILCIRRHLAMALLELLQSRWTAAASKRLGEAVDRLGAGIKGGISKQALAELDLEIALCLVESAKSRPLSLWLNASLGGFADLPHMAELVFHAPEENLAGYRALQAWLDEPNGSPPTQWLQFFALRDAQTVERLQGRVASPQSDPLDPATSAEALSAFSPT